MILLESSLQVLDERGGDAGVLAQARLREIILSYRAAFGKSAGLGEMVRAMTAGDEAKAG